MDQKRRHFFEATVGLVGATLVSLAMNSPAQSLTAPNKDSSKDNEQNVINQMHDAGYNNFILLNKRNSKLYIIQDSAILLETPVIIGRSQGQKSLTPSGVFSLTNNFRGASKPIMMFYHDATQAYSLHDVVAGREYAFQIDSTTAKRLSDGCVNVPSVALTYVLGFARQQAMENPKGLATPFVVMDEKYSAAKVEKAIQSFIPREYNPD